MNTLHQVSTLTRKATRAALTGALVVACFACGGKTSSDGTLGVSFDASADASELGAALTIPVGAYTDCKAITSEISGNIEAVGGGKGTVTLAADGDGRVSAVLAFERWMSGTVVLAPTSSVTAALTAGPFVIETMDSTFVRALTIPLAAGSLALVGDTLFVSVYGHGDDTKFSGFCSCPVSASLPKATIANRAPKAGSIPTGTYEACTTLFGGSETLVASSLSLTIAESKGILTATSSGGLPAVCSLAFHDNSGTTATLDGEQTCTVQQPCGPPPTLGPSSAPRETTLTNMAGSIEVAGGALFINVVGDAPSEACGRHTLSLICPAAP